MGLKLSDIHGFFLYILIVVKAFSIYLTGIFFGHLSKTLGLQPLVETEHEKLISFISS